MRFFRDLAVTALVTVLVTFGLEAFLRLAHLRYDASLFLREKERGFALRPHARGWNVSENDAYVTINSDGMRDRERAIPRPPDTVRIAVLGSSEAEARQVALDKTFEMVATRQLERALPGGPRVDVLNFAVEGYTLSQQYLTLRRHVWKYDPQVVLVVLNLFNMLKNTRSLYPGDPHGTPFYVLRNGKLQPDAMTVAASEPDSRRLRWRNRLADLMNQSQMLSLLDHSRAAVGRQMERLETISAHGAISDDYFQRFPYLPDLPEMQEGWAIGEAFLEDMNRECREHGAEFRIVITGLPMQTSPSAGERTAFQRRMQIPSLDASDRRLEQFAASRGIPVLLLAPLLREFATTHPVPIRFSGGHWTEAGHLVVGQAVARDLLQQSPAFRVSVESPIRRDRVRIEKSPAGE